MCDKRWFRYGVALLALFVMAGCGRGASAPDGGQPQTTATTPPTEAPAPTVGQGQKPPPTKSGGGSSYDDDYGYGYGYGSEAAEPAEPAEAAESPEPPEPAETPAGSSESDVAVDVQMTEFAFTPSRLEVPVGARVVLSLVNSGAFAHNFRLDDDQYSVRSDTLKSGESQTLEFIADKAGTFKFFCGQSGHEELGMVAELIVR